MTIPQHVRRNYERTADLLNDLDCLLAALEQLEHACAPRDATRQINAAYALRRMASEKIGEIDKARAAEWIGIGGKSDLLTDAEAANARGEAREATS